MARMLFCAAGGHGHLQPLLPLAERACAIGHEVAVSGAAALQSYVTERGLRFVPTGPDPVTNRTPLLPYDLEHERAVIGGHFIGRLGPARAHDLITLIRGWPVDLIVRDGADFGAAIAAEILRLPHAVVVIQGSGGFVRPRDIEVPLEQLRATFGLPPGNGVAALHRYLNPFPPSYRDPADPQPGAVMGYRLSSPPRAISPDRVRVYVTLGTILNTESGDLLSRVVRAVAAADRIDEVVVATGQTSIPWSWVSCLAMSSPSVLWHNVTCWPGASQWSAMPVPEPSSTHWSTASRRSVSQ